MTRTDRRESAAFCAVVLVLLAGACHRQRPPAVVAPPAAVAEESGRSATRAEEVTRPVAAPDVPTLSPAAFDSTIHARLRARTENAGYYEDVQQARLQQVPDLQVTRSESCLLVTLRHSPAFEAGSSVLAASAADELKALAMVLVEYDSTLVSVHGHTDDSGDAASNWRLSERRAVAVATALRTYGVDPARLVAVGHGSSKPVAPNDSPENRQRNRRIELHLDPLMP